MTLDSTVEETIKQIMRRVLRRPDLEFNKNETFKDLKADSLDIVQILVGVEDAYDIEIPEDEIKEMKDIEGFIASVERAIANKG